MGKIINNIVAGTTKVLSQISVVSGAALVTAGAVARARGYDTAAEYLCYSGIIVTGVGVSGIILTRNYTPPTRNRPEIVEDFHDSYR